MRHDITIEGKAFRLRPVKIEDVAFITNLRSDPKLTRLLHPPSTTISDQTQWLNGYFERLGDYYFIVEQRKTAQSHGTIAIYELDPNRKCALWGRWFIQPGSEASVESAFLIYIAAFEVLKLDTLYCHVVPDNAQVVLFHRLSGLVTHSKFLPKYQKAGDVTFDSLELTITRDAWERRKTALEAKATLIAKMYYTD